MLIFGLFLTVCPASDPRVEGLTPEVAARVRGRGLREPAGQQHPHGRWVQRCHKGVIDSSLTTYSTPSKKWNIFSLIWLNMENNNFSSRCLSASAFTLTANTQNPASSLFFKVVAGIGIVAPAGYSAHFFQVHFTSVIPSTKTIKLIGRGVYNPAIIIWSKSPEGLPIL